MANVAQLVRRLAAVLSAKDAEVLFVDDSDDETAEAIRAVAQISNLPVRLLHRLAEDRSGGLGGAVKAGIAASNAEWIVVMDGDLQHPPETIPLLLGAAVTRRLDIVVASRHCHTGTTDGLSSRVRRSLSAGAKTAAKMVFPRRLSGVTDPMSGFFALRRSAIDPSCLRPMGFKILLEILGRTSVRNVGEVPFEFGKRTEGESKASGREALFYLWQLARLRCSSWKAGLKRASVALSGNSMNRLGGRPALADGVLTGRKL
jgi:dolichol-phosphate mannosyltransferase